jgi:hypothetical protein
VAVVVWVGSRPWLRVAGIVAGLVLSVIALVLAATDLASPGSLFGVARDRLTARAIPVSAGVGLYLVLAGSIIAVGAAVWWLVANRRWWMGPEPVLPRMDAGPPTSEPPAPADAPTTQLPPITEPGLAEG